MQQLIRAQGEVGPELEGALEALELARWDDLPEAELPWGEVIQQAALQGTSEADIVWDMSGRKKEPRAPRAKAKGTKQARKPAKRARRSAT